MRAALCSTTVGAEHLHQRGRVPPLCESELQSRGDEPCILDVLLWIYRGRLDNLICLLPFGLEYVRDTPPLRRADRNTAEVDADGSEKKMT